MVVPKMLQLAMLGGASQFSNLRGDQNPEQETPAEWRDNA
jgi:hypothetical protein